MWGSAYIVTLLSNNQCYTLPHAAPYILYTPPYTTCTSIYSPYVYTPVALYYTLYILHIIISPYVIMS